MAFAQKKKHIKAFGKRCISCCDFPSGPLGHIEENSRRAKTFCSENVTPPLISQDSKKLCLYLEVRRKSDHTRGTDVVGDLRRVRIPFRTLPTALPLHCCIAMSSSTSTGRCGICGACNSAPPWSPERLKELDPEGRERVLLELKEKEEGWKRGHGCKGRRGGDENDEEHLANGMVEVALHDDHRSEIEDGFGEFTGTEEVEKENERFEEAEVVEETHVVVKENEYLNGAMIEREVVIEEHEAVVVTTEEGGESDNRPAVDSESDVDSFVTAPLEEDDESLGLDNAASNFEQPTCSDEHNSSNKRAEDETTETQHEARAGDVDERGEEENSAKLENISTGDESATITQEQGLPEAIAPKSILSERSLKAAQLPSVANNSRAKVVSFVDDPANQSRFSIMEAADNDRPTTGCEHCKGLRKRIGDLEQHVQSLEAALSAKDMSIAALKGTMRSAGQGGRRERELRLRQEVESLRVTCDFLYRRLQSSDKSKQVEPQVH